MFGCEKMAKIKKYMVRCGRCNQNITYRTIYGDHAMQRCKRVFDSKIMFDSIDDAKLHVKNNDLEFLNCKYDEITIEI